MLRPALLGLLRSSSSSSSSSTRVTWLALAVATGSRYNSSSNSSSDAQPKPPISQKTRFSDKLRVTVKGGRGGGGSSALFGRTGHHPRAAGGNGAAGGSVVLRATKQLTGLGSSPLHVEAARGGHGGKQWMDGRKGADRVVPVPLGTLVWRLLQLQGSSSRPHGVTPNRTAAAGAWDIYQTPSAVTTAAAAAAAASAREQVRSGTAASPHIHHGSNSTYAGNSLRRRLFQQEQSVPVAAAIEHANSSRGQLVGLGDAAAAEAAACDAVAVGSSSTDDDNAGDGAFKYLYEQLITCKRLLSNAEKLHLLHNGCLIPAVDLHQAWHAHSEYDADDSGPLGDTYDWRAAGTGQWSAKEQQPTLEGEQDVPVRQFSRAQVWAILEAQAELLGELYEEGQQLLVAHGGRGAGAMQPCTAADELQGLQAGSGQTGLRVLLLLQLRLLADVVLVGLPNVGKSSLIAAMTGARAQVGSYAFTTLRPQLGVITGGRSAAGPPGSHQRTAVTRFTATDMSTEPLAAAEYAAAGSSNSGRQLVLADLPGLVPGAHAGKGRGTAFLAHLERARCLALVLDMTGSDSTTAHHQQLQASCLAGEEGTEADVPAHQLNTAAAGRVEPSNPLVPHSPEQQLAILQEELAQYNARVLNLPMLVVANKVDQLSPAAATAAVQQLKAATALPIVLVSAKQHMGLSRLKRALEMLVPNPLP